MDTMRQQMSGLVERAVSNNRWRQRQCFNLIPSEMTPSLLVKLLEVADPAGRYAEHRGYQGQEVYYYQGTDFIRQVEEECRAKMGEYLDCSEVELRLCGTISDPATSNLVARSLAFAIQCPLIQ